jgi:predicted HTH transcriptional regulator
VKIEELLAGESSTVEFKRDLPDKSDKYMKTVVGFSNTSGGKIIIGVEDKTRKVVGVSNK